MKRSIVTKAVITGDIIHSSRIDDEHKAMLYDSIKQALITWNKDYKMKSELYRGDSFQCLLSDASQALRVALVMKSFIRSLTPTESYASRGRFSSSQKGMSFLRPFFIFDARITIGIGSTSMETAKLATSDGEAFQLSGRELDDIKSTKRSISIASNDRYADELRTGSIMLDAIFNKTTAPQCEVIYLKLLGYTEIEIAEQLEVKQSAINQRANSANWFAIEAFVKRFEAIYE